MTVWTPEQVAGVRGTRTVIHVDAAATRRSFFAPMSVVRHRVARVFIQECHVHAVEVHPGDIAFAEEVTDFGVRVTARWAPETRVVELRGGPSDGTVVEVQDPSQAVHVNIEAPMPPFPSSPVHPDAYVSTSSLVYVPTGWDETERRWVFTATTMRP